MEVEDELEDIFGRLTLESARGTDGQVVVVYEPRMQGHAPPGVRWGFQELPRRVIAIEARLRGLLSLPDEPVPLVPPLPPASPSRKYAWGESVPLPPGGLESRTVAKLAKERARNLPLAALFDLPELSPGPDQFQPTLLTSSSPESLWARCRSQMAPVASVEWLLLAHSEPHLRSIARKTLAVRHDLSLSFFLSCSLALALTESDFVFSRLRSVMLHIKIRMIVTFTLVHAHFWLPVSLLVGLWRLCNVCLRSIILPDRRLLLFGLLVIIVLPVNRLAFVFSPMSPLRPSTRARF